MPTFSLSAEFSKQDLERFFAAGSNVVVAKPTQGGSPNVAWVVFRPLLANQMTWEENYGIYASNADLVNGASLFQISQTEFPAASGQAYDMEPAGYFGPPQSGGTPNSYTARNDYNNDKGYLTMGLFQNATVNGTLSKGNAISAALVQYASTAVMTPFTTVSLWIQSQVKSNSVVTNVTSPITSITFGGTVTDVALRYNPGTGTFVPAAELDPSVRVDALVAALV
jgi:hypothetical protein